MTVYRNYGICNKCTQVNIIKPFKNDILSWEAKLIVTLNYLAT